MPINFPATPTIGDTYEYGGRTYVWSGNRWSLVSTFGETPWDTMPQNRNLLINGAFDIWQRGTSVTGPLGAATYGPDRWRCADGGDGHANVSRGRTTSDAGAGKYSLDFDMITPATTGLPNIQQRIEGVYTGAGETLTLTLTARLHTGQSPITVQPTLTQFFGSASATPSVDVPGEPFVVTDSWTRFERQFTLPIITGDPVGSSVDDHLRLLLTLPYNATFTLRVADAQLEIGPVATAFGRRHIGQETALCQRYYVHRLPIGASGYASGAGQTARALGYVSFPVEMRAAPAYSLGSIADDLATFTVGNSTVNTTGIGLSPVSEGTGPLFWQAQLTLDAEL